MRTKLKYVVEIVNGATPSTAEPDYWDGSIEWATPDDLGKLTDKYIFHTTRKITEAGLANCGASLSPKGSILLSTRAPIGHIAISQIPICCNQGCRILKPTSHIETSYMFYYLSDSKACLNAWGQGSTFVELSRERLAAMQINLPPIDEQQAIASFLDRETGRIDALIQKKERMIELLKEKRIAMITQAVTKGLDPNVPMKDSGIEWLGEVPEHWEVIKLKFIGKALIGLTYNPDDIVFENGTLVLRASNIQDSSLSLGREDDVYVEAQIPRKLMVIINDILICSRNGSRSLIGKSAIVKSDLYATFGAFMTVYRSRFNTFIRWVLQSSMFSGLCSGYVTSTINQLTQDSLNNISVPLPSENELERINEFLESEVHRSETMIAKTEHSISLLREYRSSLIHHAVTGKIDLRGYDAQAQ